MRGGWGADRPSTSIACECDDPAGNSRVVGSNILNRLCFPIESSAMSLPNPAVAIPSIMKSTDTAWLTSFRRRMVEVGAQNIVDAIDERFIQLRGHAAMERIGKPITTMEFKERVWEAVRVYEEFLAIKHEGKRIKASRTRTMIQRWGEEEAVRRTVRNLDMSNGLDLLAKYGRLDCAYEQIILDFPDRFDSETKMKAQANLDRLPT